jgi:hypothetical protein
MDDIEKEVDLWDRRIKSLPTFEELRDVEFIRQSGRINMILDDLRKELYDRKRYDGCMWIERCRANRIPWISIWAEAMAHYQKVHGDPRTWFTKELLDNWEEFEILEEERALKRRLEELRSKRRENSR